MSMTLDHALSSTVAVSRRHRKDRDEKRAQHEEGSSQWFEDNRLEWEASALGLLRKVAGVILDPSCLDAHESPRKLGATAGSGAGHVALAVNDVAITAVDGPNLDHSMDKAVVIEASASEVNDSPAMDTRRRLRGRNASSSNPATDVDGPSNPAPPTKRERADLSRSDNVIANGNDDHSRDKARIDTRDDGQSGGDRSPAQKRSKTKLLTRKNQHATADPVSASLPRPQLMPSATAAPDSEILSNTSEDTSVSEAIAALRAIRVGSMKVVDLRAELRKLGESSTGLKAALQVRLQDAIDARVKELERTAAQPVAVEEQTKSEMDDDQEQQQSDVEIIQDVPPCGDLLPEEVTSERVIPSPSNTLGSEKTVDKSNECMSPAARVSEVSELVSPAQKSPCSEAAMPEPERKDDLVRPQPADGDEPCDRDLASDSDSTIDAMETEESEAAEVGSKSGKPEPGVALRSPPISPVSAHTEGKGSHEEEASTVERPPVSEGSPTPPGDAAGGEASGGKHEEVSSPPTPRALSEETHLEVEHEDCPPVDDEGGAEIPREGQDREDVSDGDVMRDDEPAGEPVDESAGALPEGEQVGEGEEELPGDESNKAGREEGGDPDEAGSNGSPHETSAPMEEKKEEPMDLEQSHEGQSSGSPDVVAMASTEQERGGDEDLQSGENPEEEQEREEQQEDEEEEQQEHEEEQQKHEEEQQEHEEQQQEHEEQQQEHEEQQQEHEEQQQEHEEQQQEHEEQQQEHEEQQQEHEEQQEKEEGKQEEEEGKQQEEEQGGKQERKKMQEHDQQTLKVTTSSKVTSSGTSERAESCLAKSRRPADTAKEESGSSLRVSGTKRALAPPQTEQAEQVEQTVVGAVSGPESGRPGEGSEGEAKKGSGGSSSVKRQKVGKDKENTSLQERMRDLNRHYSAKKSQVHLEGSASAPAPAAAAYTDISTSGATSAPKLSERLNSSLKTSIAHATEPILSSTATVTSSVAAQQTPASLTTSAGTGGKGAGGSKSPADALALCLANDGHRSSVAASSSTAGGGAVGIGLGDAAVVSATFQPGAVKKPSNLISGMHSFTSLLGNNEPVAPAGRWDRLAAGTSASAARTVPALRKAEEAKALEEKRARERAAARAKAAAAAGQSGSAASAGAGATASGDRGTASGTSGSAHHPAPVPLRKTGMLAKLVPATAGREPGAMSTSAASSLTAALDSSSHRAQGTDSGKNTSAATYAKVETHAGDGGPTESRGMSTLSASSHMSSAEKMEMKIRDQRAQMAMKRNMRMEKLKAEEEKKKAELEMKGRREAARMEATRRAKQEADARAREHKAQRQAEAERRREQDRLEKENRDAREREEREARRRAVEEAIAKAERVAAAVAATSATCHARKPPRVMSSAFPGAGTASVSKPAAPAQGHGSATAAKATAFGPAGTTSKHTGSVLAPLSTNTQPLPSSSSSSQSARAGKFPEGGAGKDAAAGVSGLNPKAAAPKSATTEEPAFESYEMSDREDSSSDSETDEEKEKARKKKIPSWVKGSALTEALNRQFAGDNQLDPDTIFPPVMSCDLEAIFPVNKSRYHRRGSSANWDPDRITPQEILAYKRSVGIVRSGK